MNGVFKKFKVTRKRKYEKEQEDIETEFRQREKKRLGKKGCGRLISNGV